MKEREILILVKARNLIRSIDQRGGLCQGGEQSPNSIECIDVAAEIDSVLPPRVLADPHYGCVGICCANKKKRRS